jgi:(R,R)-butanediol dehydrogenase/meso-butanediol dehydrogenase/diacetyl reductase
LAVDLVGYQGRVVVQGRPSKPVEVSQTTVLVKEVEVVGAVSCTAAEFAQAVRHLEAGELTGEDIVTDTVGLDEVGKKFSELLNPDSRQLKVLVAPAR